MAPYIQTALAFKKSTQSYNVYTSIWRYNSTIIYKARIKSSHKDPFHARYERFCSRILVKTRILILLLGTVAKHQTYCIPYHTITLCLLKLTFGVKVPTKKAEIISMCVCLCVYFSFSAINAIICLAQCHQKPSL